MNMGKKAFILLLALGCAFPAFSQQSKIIRGRVMDKNENTPVIGANIIEFDKENRLSLIHI